MAIDFNLIPGTIVRSATPDVRIEPAPVNLIITQTPLRISFLGGGTDFRDFYRREGGCVLATAINKYVFAIIKERFDDRVRVGYTKTELVDNVSHLEHELIREALRKAAVSNGLEIATMADVPSEGSGLGSSSAVTVGVLNAIYAYRNSVRDAETLAQESCEIEIDVLKRAMGIQDQYLSAYGGLRFLRFLPDDQVRVESVNLSNDAAERMSEYICLYYTNSTRKAESILVEQQANIEHHRQVLRRMGELAPIGKDLLEKNSFDDFGRLLDESWRLKKKLASKVSNKTIDAIYETACRAGALGGKVTGAGGGGFLLLWCPPEKQEKLAAALYPLRRLPIRLEPSGSKVIFNYSHH